MVWHGCRYSTMVDTEQANFAHFRCTNLFEMEFPESSIKMLNMLLYVVSAESYFPFPVGVVPERNPWIQTDFTSND